MSKLALPPGRRAIPTAEVIGAPGQRGGVTGSKAVSVSGLRSPGPPPPERERLHSSTEPSSTP
eukprot:10357895-Heterocapsa_arctica.AAC.2